jgi:hypothetical protein
VAERAVDLRAVREGQIVRDRQVELDEAFLDVLMLGSAD